MKDVLVERGTDIDVWFAKDSRGQLWYAVAEHDEPAGIMPRAGRSKGLTGTLQRIKRKGYKVVLVGICDADMLGVEG